MALAPGVRFGSYEVAESIGSGGMGEVYRATDSVLKRDVALKVLTPAFDDDADRLARFKREAELLASLNHVNIATIHGLEKVDDQTVIVMEMVEGPTLEDRIKEGPLPADEAMGIALQVVAALEAAHEKGIIHRDLKPANVKVRDDGTVKVLDFGISKPIDTREISGGSVVATPAVTQTGVILGTAAYMSPEQARGKFVDQRTDIWAFGCLLFEMLTGQPAFGGEDVMLTLARVLANDTNLDSIPGTISPAVRHTIKLCLEKDPRKRIADIRDVRLALEGTFESELPAALAPESASPAWRRALPIVAAALMTGAAVWLLKPEPSPEAQRVTTFVHQLPSGLFSMNQPVAMAPDGSEFVFATRAGLMRRRVDDLEPQVIPGTEGRGGVDPGYAPDGTELVYYSSVTNVLQIISVNGGAPRPLTGISDGSIGSWKWAADGMIYVISSAGLSRVFPDTGEYQTLIADEALLGSSWPEPLPGSRFVLVDRQMDDNPAEIIALDLETGQSRPLFPGIKPSFLEPNILVYWEPTLGLAARAFDPVTLDHGDAVPLVEDVSEIGFALRRDAAFSVGAGGSLAYARGIGLVSRQPSERLLALLDPSGELTMLRFSPAEYGPASVSPNGGRLAVEIREESETNIYILDLTADTEPRPLTSEGSNRSPAWSLDGDWIAFVSNREGASRIYRRRANLTGVIEQVVDPGDIYPSNLTWAPDDRLAYDSGSRIFIVEIPNGTPEPLVDRPGRHSQLSFSPQGDAMAYRELPPVDPSPPFFRQQPVQPTTVLERFPPDGTANRIDDASNPLWSDDGELVAFQTNSGIGIVNVVDTDSLDLRDRQDLDVTEGVTLLDRIPNTNTWLVSVPLADDSEASLQPASTEIVVILNWIEEVKAEVPPLER